MRVYVLKDSDFEALTTAVDRNPKHGYRGSSSTVLSAVEQQAHDEAHRFFNYQVHDWIMKMQKGDRL